VPNVHLRPLDERKINRIEVGGITVSQSTGKGKGRVQNDRLSRAASAVDRGGLAVSVVLRGLAVDCDATTRAGEDDLGPGRDLGISTVVSNQRARGPAAGDRVADGNFAVETARSTGVDAVVITDKVDDETFSGNLRADAARRAAGARVDGAVDASGGEAKEHGKGGEDGRSLHFDCWMCRFLCVCVFLRLLLLLLLLCL
jgi:hypothetical protein